MLNFAKESTTWFGISNHFTMKSGCTWPLSLLPTLEYSTNVRFWYLVLKIIVGYFCCDSKLLLRVRKSHWHLNSDMSKFLELLVGKTSKKVLSSSTFKPKGDDQLICLYQNKNNKENKEKDMLGEKNSNPSLSIVQTGVVESDVILQIN